MDLISCTTLAILALRDSVSLRMSKKHSARIGYRPKSGK